MSETRIEQRVKAVIAGVAAETATTEHPMISPRTPGQTNHALQVLTLAQRTAAEHVAAANRQADKIRQDAQTAADEVARTAESHEQDASRRADQMLAEARATADKAAADARKRAEDASRNAEQILSEARAQAERITQEALDHAEEMKVKAQQRYDDSVGTLRARREALQQQIEALERFDSEYRNRLTSFMQRQLRALWPDRPQVGAGPDPIEPPSGPAEPSGSSGSSGSSGASGSSGPSRSSGSPGPSAPSGRDVPSESGPSGQDAPAEPGGGDAEA
jgi:cell division septum initiation protein DivIVA